METGRGLRLEASGAVWRIADAGAGPFDTVSQYLGYLDDWDYSSATVRACHYFEV